MIRKQFQLPDEDYRRLKALAAKRNVSIAELVREGIQRVIDDDEAEYRRKWANAWKFVGSGHDIEGKTDVAVNHDKYLEEIWGEDNPVPGHVRDPGGAEPERQGA